MILENDNPYNTPKQEERRVSIMNPMPFSGYGKLPPQACDLEEAVLGAILIQKEAILEVSDFLRAECFYKDSHQKIYSACLTLFSKGDPIDLLTIRSQLSKQGELELIGGVYYLTELTSRVSSSANIEAHAKIIYQKYIQREVIRIGMEAINEGYNDTTDALELLEKSQLDLFNLGNVTVSNQAERIDSLITEGLKQIDIPATGNLTGVGTGFTCIDYFNSGWQNSELTILAARPAMGKTALMMQLARNAAVIHSIPTIVFSLEMSKQQLINRMISNESEVFLEKINKKKLNPYDRQILESKLEKLRHSPLHIDDTAGISIMQFRSKILRAKRLYNIGFCVVDYLQLMKGDNARGGNRDQEIGQITRGLKQVAKELNIPIFALSQLSRETEKRPGVSNRPKLSDLRESGNIEQDADNVYFLYRPEYYGIKVDAENNSTEQMAELICAKHRNGACETLFLKFRGAVMRFENWVDNKPIASLPSPYTLTQIVNNASDDEDNDSAPF